jgi:alpha-1,6-mannosyltransferase
MRFGQRVPAGRGRWRELLGAFIGCVLTKQVPKALLEAVAVKILDVTEFFSERGGGVRAYLTQLLREGTLRGHRVVVVAPGPRAGESTVEGGRLVRVAGPAMPYDPSYHALWNVSELRALVARERPDVLQASSPYVAAYLAATQVDVPVRALVLHSDQIGSYARPVLSRLVGGKAADFMVAPLWAGLRALSSRFDLTVVSARWLAARLEAAGVPRVVQAPFGIDRARFSPALRDEGLRAALLGAKAGDPRARLVVLVGRLALEKRVAFVLEALAIVARRRPLAVVVLGDGPERQRLEVRATKLGLGAVFTGFVTDRERYARTVASADALVHGCAVETFGFAVAEALASGVAVAARAARANSSMRPAVSAMTLTPLRWKPRWPSTGYSISHPARSPQERSHGRRRSRRRVRTSMSSS